MCFDVMATCTQSHKGCAKQAFVHANLLHSDKEFLSAAPSTCVVVGHAKHDAGALKSVFIQSIQFFLTVAWRPEHLADVSLHMVRPSAKASYAMQVKLNARPSCGQAICDS